MLKRNLHDIIRIQGPLNEDIPISWLSDYGCDTIPEFTTRAVILDMLSYLSSVDPEVAMVVDGNRMLKAGVSITAKHLKRVLRDYDIVLVPGDAVFVYTGWQHMQHSDPVAFMDGEPGIDMSAALYLAGKRVVTVGADSWGTEVGLPKDASRLNSLPPSVNRQLPNMTLPDGTSNDIWPVHIELLYKQGVFNLENLDLAAAVNDGVREGILMLGVPKSPTPQAHINPTLIAVPDRTCMPHCGAVRFAFSESEI